jgi:hypothetical protein
MTGDNLVIIPSKQYNNLDLKYILHDKEGCVQVMEALQAVESRESAPEMTVSPH